MHHDHDVTDTLVLAGFAAIASIAIAIFALACAARAAYLAVTRACKHTGNILAKLRNR